MDDPEQSECYYAASSFLIGIAHGSTVSSFPCRLHPRRDNVPSYSSAHIPPNSIIALEDK